MKYKPENLNYKQTQTNNQVLMLKAKQIKLKSNISISETSNSPLTRALQVFIYMEISCGTCSQYRAACERSPFPPARCLL